MDKNVNYHSLPRHEILKLISAAPNRVLDIGCGKGGVAKMLRQKYPGLHVVGFDKYVDESFNYSDYFSEFHNLDLLGEWPEIDYTNFDLVLLLDILEHLTDPHVVLLKLSKVLKTGTNVIISLPNFHHYSNLVDIIKTGRFKYRESGILDHTHFRFFGREDARDLIAPYFEIKAIAPHYLQPRGWLNKFAGLTIGDTYAAYQNLFLCDVTGL